MLALLAGGLTLHAAPILIYNTGVDDSNVVLTDGAVDPHYALVTSADPSFPGPDAVLVNSATYPIPPWLANSSTSRWIAPRTDQITGNAPGTYIYRTTFSLAGLNPATAVLTGQWASDNDGSIRLNGSLVTGGTSGATGNGDFGAFTAFTLNSANATFVPGLNTLDFIAINTDLNPNPTGVRVEVAGSADVVTGSDIPEPATFALVGFVLTAGTLLTRRRA